MKERPILFSAPMVRALLAGTKTQTRRVVKKLPITLNRETNSLEVDVENIANGRFAKLVACPCGQPGDRLWVRETFGFSGSGYIPDIHFRATNPEAPILGRWHPSIHMRRIDSRITLEITSVRVERLQEISEADALAEGIAQVVHDKLPVQQCGEYDGIDVDPVELYQDLWESINGPGSWDADPWVWVLEFRRINSKEIEHAAE